MAKFHRAQYKAVAEIISDRLKTAKLLYAGKPEYLAGYTSAVLSVAEELADIFANDNGLFDRGRFMRTANPEDVRR